MLALMPAVLWLLTSSISILHEVKFAEVHDKALRFKVNSVDSHPPWLGSSPVPRSPLKKRKGDILAQK